MYLFFHFFHLLLMLPEIHCSIKRMPSVKVNLALRGGRLEYLNIFLFISFLLKGNAKLIRFWFIFNFLVICAYNNSETYLCVCINI